MTTQVYPQRPVSLFWRGFCDLFGWKYPGLRLGSPWPHWGHISDKRHRAGCQLRLSAVPSLWWAKQMWQSNCEHCPSVSFQKQTTLPLKRIWFWTKFIPARIIQKCTSRYFISNRTSCSHKFSSKKRNQPCKGKNNSKNDSPYFRYFGHIILNMQPNLWGHSSWWIQNNCEKKNKPQQWLIMSCLTQCTESTEEDLPTGYPCPLQKRCIFWPRPTSTIWPPVYFCNRHKHGRKKTHWKHVYFCIRFLFCFVVVFVCCEL